MKAGASKATLRLADNNQSSSPDTRQRRIHRSSLINLLNRINFRDGIINIHFRHQKYNHLVNVQARPQICNDDFIRCLWSEHFDAEQRLRHFRFQFFTFSDGLNQIQVAATLMEMNNNGVFLELPDYCHQMKAREIKRHSCTGINAQIIRDGRVIEANLVSFSAQSFSLSFLPESHGTDPRLNQGAAVNVVLRDGDEFLFSGSCEIIRQNVTANKNHLIVKPARSNIRLFRAKEIRSERLTLTPQPNIHFTHPLTGKKESPSLVDISGTGFCVAEDEDSAVLMPGLIIPKLEIEFIHGFSVNCRAQVIYRLKGDSRIRCGIAITDMAMKDHLKLSSCLHQARNKHSYISTTHIDLEALWDFFFESGFIYPDKYLHISEQKEHFQKLYRKLYNESPGISRHVMYQDKGKIYGHVSMFRYYRSTWLMHHHAAIKSSRHRAGLVVMEHILQYINESHTLPSARMRHIACYFRPDNRFADRVFGGAARALDDPAKCSLDKFAYLHFTMDQEPQKVPGTWTVEETGPDDLYILRHWYAELSGGLLLQGLDLVPEAKELDRKTDQEYRAAGFTRYRKLYSLKKKDGELVALFIVNKSDIGLNMSDLTNCIQVFILEQEILDRNLLYAMLADFSIKHDYKDTPVLLYPDTAAKDMSIPYDKIYELTVLDLDNICPYLQFMRSLTTPRERKVKHLS